jgi:intein-encoded DNA endonuclease-like protein
MVIGESLRESRGSDRSQSLIAMMKKILGFQEGKPNLNVDGTTSSRSSTKKQETNQDRFREDYQVDQLNLQLL